MLVMCILFFWLTLILSIDFDWFAVKVYLSWILSIYIFFLKQKKLQIYFLKLFIHLFFLFF